MRNSLYRDLCKNINHRLGPKELVQFIKNETNVPTYEEVDEFIIYNTFVINRRLKSRRELNEYHNVLIKFIRRLLLKPYNNIIRVQYDIFRNKFPNKSFLTILNFSRDAAFPNTKRTLKTINPKASNNEEICIESTNDDKEPNTSTELIVIDDNESEQNSCETIVVEDDMPINTNFVYLQNEINSNKSNLNNANNYEKIGDCLPTNDKVLNEEGYLKDTPKKYKENNALEVVDVKLSTTLDDCVSILNIINRNITFFPCKDFIEYFGLGFKNDIGYIEGIGAIMECTDILYVPIPCKLGGKVCSSDGLLRLVHLFKRATKIRIQMCSKFTKSYYECAVYILNSRKWREIQLAGHITWREAFNTMRLAPEFCIYLSSQYPH